MARRSISTPLLVAFSAALLPVQSSSPVPIDFTIGSGGLPSAVLNLCSLDWAKYKSDPALYPMFKDHITASGCTGDKVTSKRFDELETEYKSRKCDVDPSGVGCSPSGLVFHQSRCGSTLVANLLASLPHAITYSESVAPALVVLSAKLTREEKVRALRVVVAAMGAPLADRDAAVLEGPATGKGTGTGSPARMFFKLQSMLSLDIDVWREAFPSTPWLFVHREGVEILASLFRGQAPTGDAGTLQGTTTRLPPKLQMVPCLRGAQAALKAPPTSPEFALQLAIAGVSTGAELVRLPPESYCAAQTASYAASALANLLHARMQAWQASGRKDVLTIEQLSLPLSSWQSLLGPGEGAGQGLAIDYTGLPDTAVQALGGHFGVEMSEDLHAQLLKVSTRYSKARVAPSDEGSDAEAGSEAGSGAGVGAGVGTGGKGAGAGKAGLRAPLQDSGIVPKGWRGPDRAASQYIDDSEAKQAAAWVGLRLAGATYMQPWRAALLSLSGEGEGQGGHRVETGQASAGAESKAAGSVSVEALLSSVRAAARTPLLGPIPSPASLLPLGQGYPSLYPLADILTYWSADIVSVPPDYGKYSSLRVFDWRVPSERAEAEQYRRAEVPFIARHISSLDRTAQAWASDEGLLAAVGGAEAQHEAEINVAGSNHFMYWNKARARKDKNYTPPTKEARVKAGEWLSRAHAVQEAVVAEERAQLPSWWFRNATTSTEEKEERDSGLALPPLGATRSARELWYMRISTDQRNVDRHAFIHKSLTFVSPEGSAAAKTDPDRRFFLVDEAQQRGIHCRFGQPGIIAEAHYDGGRNFINMVRGSKRYILAPPSECPNMALLKDGPSARHSAADWSDPASWPLDSPLYSALGLEVILHAGDSLYVPALWFHYIISLEVNVQCNTRSGTPRMYEVELSACGFSASFTEPLGQHTDTNAPALQPNRAKHMEAWRQSWPQESKEGLLGATSTGGGSVGPSAYVRQLAASVARKTGAAPAWAGSALLGLPPASPTKQEGVATSVTLQPQIARVLAKLLPSLTTGLTTAPQTDMQGVVSALEAVPPAPVPPLTAAHLALRLTGSEGGQAPAVEAGYGTPWSLTSTFGGSSSSSSSSAQLRAQALVRVMRSSVLWVALGCTCIMAAIVARATGMCGVRSTLWRACCCWLCFPAGSGSGPSSAGSRPGAGRGLAGSKEGTSWQVGQAMTGSPIAGRKRLQ